MAQRHFQRGSGVFTCQICKRRTRITTQYVSHLCAECYDLAGLQNALWDGCFTDEDRPYRDEMLAKAVRAGGNEERIRHEFEELFAA